MKALSIGWYKIPVGIRRFLGVLLLFMIAYWTFTFSVKLICYLLYAGTKIIDVFFKFLVRWGKKMKNCYCHTCDKEFNSLGIARHRAMHREKKEDCKITFKDGKTLNYKFSQVVKKWNY